jgi:hypothetical protein
MRTDLAVLNTVQCITERACGFVLCAIEEFVVFAGAGFHQDYLGPRIR